MDTIIITFDGEFVDLNTFIKVNNRNRFACNDIKQADTNKIIYQCINKKYKPIPEEMYPLDISFTWFIPNKKKDPDNICFSKKSILDGLVKARILTGDGQKQIKRFGGEDFIISSDTGVRIEIKKA